MATTTKTYYSLAAAGMALVALVCALCWVWLPAFHTNIFGAGYQVMLPVALVLWLLLLNLCTSTNFVGVLNFFFQAYSCFGVSRLFTSALTFTCNIGDVARPYPAI